MKLNDYLPKEIAFKNSYRKQNQKISRNKENHKLQEQLWVGFNNNWKVKRRIMNSYIHKKLSLKGLLKNKKQKFWIQRKNVKINMINL